MKIETDVKRLHTPEGAISAAREIIDDGDARGAKAEHPTSIWARQTLEYLAEHLATRLVK